MRRIIMLFIIISCLSLVSCSVKGNQQPPEPGENLTAEEEQLIRELNEQLIPLTSSPLSLSDDQLSFLDRLQNTRLVALGEATHGTREFFQMKHRIFQYLVEHFNHKAFGFEADFAECIYLNRYVTTGEGNLEELMTHYMHFWTWKTEEVKELLEWMKNFNTGRNEAEKVHYFGFDCQYTNLQPGLLHEYLQRTMPQLWDTYSTVIEQVKGLTQSDYLGMSSETFNSLKTQLETFENQLIANKDGLISTSSLWDYEIHKQLTRTFLQALILGYYNNQNDSPNWRDRFMAENALWIANFFGSDAKITLWAHNAHIARDSTIFGDGSMGFHLYNQLNDQYQAVGFGFSQGSFTAIDAKGLRQLKTHRITAVPRRDSINFLFHQASQPNYSFHLDNIPQGSGWSNWLNEVRPFLMIGASFDGKPDHYYLIINLCEHYNWLIYFDNTNASQILQPNPGTLFNKP